MMKQDTSGEISTKVYAGVLGKIIGVYMGRPVEGWSYNAIKDRFGEVDRYVNAELGLPLIVADDDISGTFGFFRVMEDHGYPQDLRASMVGNTWLNYIIEDKTILWWGGLGRSTEHTAFLRLKAGIKAPQSGSAALNGKTISEQIGAQIFMDAFAMMCPNDPERAARYVREAAGVSHDGIALDAAAFLGAMEADAFSVRDMNVLIDRNLRFVSDSFLLKVIDDVRTICAHYCSAEWRDARSEIDMRYGYHKFDGPCHIVPNHAMILAALLLGGNDFHRSLTIAASAAWDTDCNAGNVGCLNGIRLGLDALNKHRELREQVADRMLVITADGGSCVTDAVIETRRILRAAGIERDNDEARFNFAFPGSVQGFRCCPLEGKGPNSGMELVNGNCLGKPSGLWISIKSKDTVAVSTPTSIDFTELAGNFSTLASPTLYEGQMVHIDIELIRGTVELEPYGFYYTADQKTARISLGSYHLSAGLSHLSCRVPDIGGMPIFRFGLHSTALEGDAELLFTRIDWRNTPLCFAQRGMMMRSIWETRPYWFQAWVGSAKQFAADFLHTYCISHPEENGIVTIGTQDWSDYQVETALVFSLHEAGGLVLRSKGLRQYYAVLFSHWNRISIVERDHERERVLASVPFDYEPDRLYSLGVVAQGEHISVTVEGHPLLNAQSGRYRNGSVGYRIDRGAIIARDFVVKEVLNNSIEGF
jgi:ADP-ribosylglycohydrolase